MGDVAIRDVGGGDREVLERLWLMFRHDMSEFSGDVPFEDGTFRRERLDAALRGEPGWAAYLVLDGRRSLGFVLVRALDEERAVLNSFFVVRGARRSGVGLRAVAAVTATRPGPWAVAFQEENAPAARFWRRAVGHVAPGRHREERRAIPGRPDLAKDSWLLFEVGQGVGLGLPEPSLR